MEWRVAERYEQELAGMALEHAFIAESVVLSGDEIMVAARTTLVRRYFQYTRAAPSAKSGSSSA